MMRANLYAEMLYWLGQVEAAGHDPVQVSCLYPTSLAHAFLEDLSISVSAIADSEQSA